MPNPYKNLMPNPYKKKIALPLLVSASFFIGGCRPACDCACTQIEAATQNQAEPSRKATPAQERADEASRDAADGEALVQSPPNILAGIDMDTPLYLQPDALPSRGNPNAKVTVVEFFDYQCPFTKSANPTIERLLAEYPDDVQVVFIHVPMPFHREAVPAAMASIAAQLQGRFWDMHNALFESQAILDKDLYWQTAERLGLDMGQFVATFESQAAGDFIDKSKRDASSARVRGTPSFLINGVELTGAQPYGAFKKAVDDAIARADAVASEKNLSGKALYRELVMTASAPKAPDDYDDDSDPARRRFVSLENAPSRGDKNARVTIVEFADFECQYSARARRTLDALLKKNKGNVRVAFKHYPLAIHEDARLASQAAEAARRQGEKYFWAMHDKLFNDQESLSREDILRHASEIKGLNLKKFQKALESDEVAQKVLDDIEAGKKADVIGTPSFFINGRFIQGAQPIEKFQELIDQELKLAKSDKYKKLRGDALYKKIIEDAIPKPKPIEVDIAGSPWRGTPDAPVTVIQFSEFQCPFCAKAEPIVQALLDDPAYAGKLKVVFKQFPLPFHGKAWKASQAAIFAHKYGKFWEMSKIMFANQDRLEIEDLKRYAAKIGLNADDLQNALASNKYEDAVNADIEAGKKAGVIGTPSFFINGKFIQGAQPIEIFKEAIDMALQDEK